jgi:ketosteroid isomerase-like protein
MSEQKVLKLVQQFYAVFKTGNINGVLSTLADDVGWFIPGPKDEVFSCCPNR